MKQKIVAVVLSALLVMAFGGTAYAADNEGESFNEAPDCEVIETVEKDPQALKQIALDEGLTAPEGQKLVAVKTTIVKLASRDEFIPAIALPKAAASISITNVRTTGYRYYSDDYDSYWYYGPYGLSASYGQTRSAGYSSTVSVSSSLVSSAVGFSVTSSYYKSGSHSANVPEGQSLNLRVHTNYLVKAFDIYNSGTKVGTGSAWRPDSLIFKEYWYA